MLNLQSAKHVFGRSKNASLRFALIVWVFAALVHGLFWLGLSLNILDLPWQEPLTRSDRRGMIGFFGSLPLIALVRFWERAVLSEAGIFTGKSGELVRWDTITSASIKDRSFGLGLLYLALAYHEGEITKHLYLPWPINKHENFCGLVLGNTTTANPLHQLLLRNRPPQSTL